MWEIKAICSGGLQYVPLFFLSLIISASFSLCFSVNASSHSHIITLWRGLGKFQHDAGLIPPLTVLTACPSSSLLFPQSHSTICKSSGPQWNRVTTEEKHKVNMAHSLFHWLIWFLHYVVLYAEHVCPFCLMFSCSCGTLVLPQGGLSVLLRNTSLRCRYASWWPSLPT